MPIPDFIDWQDRKLRQLCECPTCERDGPQSSHHDSSHDQALSQQFTVAGAVIRLRGGTTKCARVMSSWLQQHVDELDLPSKDVVEIGSGTGLVGLVLARLGARAVVLTDQAPVLSIVEDSIERNATVLERRPDAQSLYWGDPVPDKLKGMALIVGSDLIFAKENIPLLLSTFDQLCTAPDQVILFAHINRFDWERAFFIGMKALRFERALLSADDDIRLYRFRRPTTTASADY